MKILISVSILISYLLLSACTPKQADNNSHAIAPKAESQDSESLNKKLISAEVALKKLSSNKSIKADDLNTFFETYLTESFFLNYSVNKDQESRVLLRGFHNLFLLSYNKNESSQEEFNKFSLRYYHFLRTIVCDNEIKTCNSVSIYGNAPLAAEVFWKAEALIKDDLRQEFVDFVTTIGSPENNLHIKQIELAELLKEMEDSDKLSLDSLSQLVNLSLYISQKVDQVLLEPIVALDKLRKQHKASTKIKVQFEELLVSALEKKQEKPELDKIVKRYILEQLNLSKAILILEDDIETNLLKWKEDLTKYNVSEDWLKLYVFLGFYDKRRSGNLHHHFVSQQMLDEEFKKEILHISYVFMVKQFLKNVYLSHDHIAEVWHDQLSKWGKVEAIFYEFYAFANPGLNSIWNVDFFEKVKEISENLSQNYSTEELKEITYFLSQLNDNIKLFVGLPVQFIVGYFAAQQGNFDFKQLNREGATMHMDVNVYYNEIFAGRSRNFFNFFHSSRILSQEALFSFYVSLDEKILNSYGLSLDFMPRFIDLYLETEKEYLVNKRKWYNRVLLSDDGSTKQLLGYCQELKKNNNDFSYNVKFYQSPNQFFLGQAHFMTGGLSKGFGGWGTSEELVSFINELAFVDIDRSLSEDMEVVRTDMGIKLNRFNLILQALKDQGQDELLELTEESINSVNNELDNLYSNIGNHYKKMMDCVLRFTDVEEKMRLKYIQDEIKFLTSTYKALQILDSYGEDVPDLTQIRIDHPEEFADDYYLSQLPSSGSFRGSLNKLWLNIGLEFGTKIPDYVVNVISQVGFHYNDIGKWEFATNVYDSQFRRLSFIKNSESYGVDYPKFKITSYPQDYNSLKILFGKDKDLFYSLSVGDTIKTSKQFVSQVFNQYYPRQASYATTFEMNQSNSWRNLLMNYASLLKYDAYKLFRDDFDFSSYKSKVSTSLESSFDFLSDITDRLLQQFNLNEFELEFVELVASDNMIRGSKAYQGGYQGNGIFFYHSGFNYTQLGQYDLFFNALTAYHLGKKATFRTLFVNSAFSTDNPLVSDWIEQPTSDTSSSAGPGGDISAKDLFFRKNNFDNAKANSAIIKEFNDKLILKVSDQASNYIRHDYYHALHADNALAESFLEWVDKKEASITDKTPYHLDLKYHSGGIEDPDYISPMIRRQYWNSRDSFNRNTLENFMFK